MDTNIQRTACSAQPCVTTHPSTLALQHRWRVVSEPQGTPPPAATHHAGKTRSDRLLLLWHSGQHDSRCHQETQSRARNHTRSTHKHICTATQHHSTCINPTITYNVHNKPCQDLRLAAHCYCTTHPSSLTTTAMLDPNTSASAGYVLGR